LGGKKREDLEMGESIIGESCFWQTCKDKIGGEIKSHAAE